MMKFGIIGYPLTTTLSPVIYQKAFEICSLRAEYFVYPFEDISSFKEIVLKEGLQGFNVTIPHKRTALNLIDDMDVDTTNMGCINTVKVDNGKLYATNTDWLGFLSALNAENIELADINAIVLGTGGSAVASCYALAYAKAKTISIISRRQEEALKIKLLLNKSFKDISVNCYDFSNGAYLQTCGLFVNCTPIGMYAEDSLGIAKLLKYLPKNCFLFDLCYCNDSLPTYFIHVAKDLKIRCCDGLSMLVRQAAVSFNFWTELDFDIDDMLFYLRRKLCA